MWFTVLNEANKTSRSKNGIAGYNILGSWPSVVSSIHYTYYALRKILYGVASTVASIYLL